MILAGRERFGVIPMNLLQVVVGVEACDPDAALPPQNLSAHKFFLIQLSWGKGDKGDDGGGWGRGRGPVMACGENLKQGLQRSHTWNDFVT